ncbi:MAG: SRPBCC family protein [Thermodesulfobacteriota bacterium]
MSENKVVVTKVIKASPEEVFEAFTNPKIMTKWFYGDEGWTADISNTLEVGGKYNLTMLATDGKKYKHTGEYKVIAPPEKLVFTWNSDFAQNTVVTVDFRQVADGTEVTLEHDFLPTDEAREDHRKGWTICLRNLERLYA